MLLKYDAGGRAGRFWVRVAFRQLGCEPDRVDVRVRPYVQPGRSLNVITEIDKRKLSAGGRYLGD